MTVSYRLQPDYMSILKIDEHELKRRLAYFELSDVDFKRLEDLKPFADRWTHEITEGLYELIMGQPDSRVFFPDQATLTRVKKLQNSYFLGLFSGTYDMNYVRDRLRVGASHERIGMPPKLYLGAYRRYFQLIHSRLLEHFAGNESQAFEALSSIRKIIFFDMALAIDTYIAAYLETMTRHQAAIRELSTPVIEVWNGVLCLPIVGVMETSRSAEMTETLLRAVVDKRARCAIVDVTGIEVMDTGTASHFLQMAKAVRLLGAECVLTGITPGLAQTMVHMGVDLSGITTHRSLRDALGRYIAFNQARSAAERRKTTI